MRFSGQEVDLVKAELKEAKDKLAGAEAEIDTVKGSLSEATEEVRVCWGRSADRRE